MPALCLRMFFMGLLLTGFVSGFASAAEVSSPRHAVVAADNNRLVRFDKEGRVVWEYNDVKSVHGIQQLSNGNLLTQQGWGRIVEVTPDKHIAWSYDSASRNGNAGRALEVHAFQRLPNDLTMIVENGIGRVIDVDSEGQIDHMFSYQVTSPSPHRDVRQAHRLASGNTLVCHEEEGRVTEYSPGGDIVWDYRVPLFGKPPQRGHGPEAWGNQVFNALRLPNGHTLIATGNGHSVIEVTADGDITWALRQHDLPGITLAWTTALEVLPDGNILIGNCHAGPENPQFIEVTRDKEVAWTFRDFEILGNSTAAIATVGVKDVLR